MPTEFLQEKIHAVRDNLSNVIRGKKQVIDLILISMISGGHVLLDDVPGVGKTTLAKALALSVDAKFKRIQCTPDLLPADILGSSVYNAKTSEFDFYQGPIFTNILLADEINRASPRTQSALLEAMSEKQVSIEGKCIVLDDPFMVIATENPVESYGTYPLPEAQLDRFAMMISLGYPDAEAELEMLEARQKIDPLQNVKPCLSCEDLNTVREEVKQVDIEKSIASDMLTLIRATRQDDRLQLGCSPRALLTLAASARAAAWMDNRDFVTPADVKLLIHPVLAHRMVLDLRTRHAGTTAHDILQELEDKVKVPF